MLNPFQKLELIQAEMFTSMPGRFRQKGRTTWSDPNRQNAEVECFLEGPAFDREGNLYLVDTAFQRIFRITPKGDWDEVVRYDGWPNGMPRGVIILQRVEAGVTVSVVIEHIARIRHDSIGLEEVPQGGIIRTTACGRMIRLSASRRLMLRAMVASHWPRGTASTAPRTTSAP